MENGVANVRPISPWPMRTGENTRDNRSGRVCNHGRKLWRIMPLWRANPAKALYRCACRLPGSSEFSSQYRDEYEGERRNKTLMAPPLQLNSPKAIVDRSRHPPALRDQARRSRSCDSWQDDTVVFTTKAEPWPMPLKSGKPFDFSELRARNQLAFSSADTRLGNA